MQALQFVECAVCSKAMSADRLCGHVSTAHLNYRSYGCAECAFTCYHTDRERIIGHYLETGHQEHRFKFHPNLESAVQMVVVESIQRSIHSARRVKREEDSPTIEIIDDDDYDDYDGDESVEPSIGGESSLSGFLTDDGDATQLEDETELRGMIELLRHGPLAGRDMELAIAKVSRVVRGPPPPLLAYLPTPPPRRIVKLWSHLRRKPGRARSAASDEAEKRRGYRRRTIDAKYRNYFEQAFEEWGDTYDGAAIREH